MRRVVKCLAGLRVMHIGGTLALIGADATGFPAQVPCPEQPSKRGPVASRTVDTPTSLRARVVSWDVGFKPKTEQEWIACVSKEVHDSIADGIDFLVFPELFTAGLGPYAPKGERVAEFITRRMTDTLLPAVKNEVAKRDMLVALGSYLHREPGWNEAFNRAPLLVVLRAS